MQIQKIQERLKEGNGLSTYDSNELKYLESSSIGKAIYVNKRGRPRVSDELKAKSTDRITCKDCGKQYIRSNATNHKKTTYHIIHEKMNEKLKKIMLDDK